MSEQFYTILTKLGKAKIANASALGTTLNLIKFKVGDSNGSYYNPMEDQQALKNKVWEGPVSSITIDENNPNWIIIQAMIPGDIGGFMIREAGVFDSEDNLIAIGKYPETYKPLASEGSSKDLFIKMILEVSNTASVTLKIDPTVILATKKDIQILEQKIENIKVPVESVNSKTGAIELKAEDINCEDGKSIESHLEDIVTKELPKKIDANNYVANNAFAVTSGTSTAYTITLNPVPERYEDGMQITIKPHIACGNNPTLNINGLGALPIKNQEGSNIPSGDIKANIPISLVRVGSNFFIRNSGVIKVNGLINPYIVAEGENIKSGDFVSLKNNKIIKFRNEYENSIKTTFNSQIVSDAIATGENKAVILKDKLFVAYTKSTRSAVYCQLYDISNNKQTKIGDEIQLLDTPSTTELSIEYLTNNKIIIIATTDEKNVYGVICTIENNNIIQHTKHIIDSKKIDNIKLINIDENRILATYRFEYKLYIRIFKISSTIISAETEYQLYDNAYIGQLTKLSSSTFFLEYQLMNSKSIYGTIISINNFNKSSVFLFNINNNTTIEDTTFEALSDKQILATYSDYYSNKKGILINIDGTTVTTTDIDNKSLSGCFVKNGKDIIMLYLSAGNIYASKYDYIKNIIYDKYIVSTINESRQRITIINRDNIICIYYLSGSNNYYLYSNILYINKSLLGIAKTSANAGEIIQVYFPKEE